MDEEKILPLGAEITAVGVLQTAPDGTPVVKSSKRLPIFLYVFLKHRIHFYFSLPTFIPLLRTMDMVHPQLYFLLFHVLFKFQLIFSMSLL